MRRHTTQIEGKICAVLAGSMHFVGQWVRLHMANYYTSGCARSHCPASQMWIRSGSATWRRQCHRNWTHPLTTPKQQTCQWERRWMIFFYRPKCSYRFIFFLRVETSAPGLSGYYWYHHISCPEQLHEAMQHYKLWSLFHLGTHFFTFGEEIHQTTLRPPFPLSAASPKALFW